MAQTQLKDYRGWKIVANRHPGYTIVMGYKVNKKGVATDVAEAETVKKLHNKIDLMEG